jgi:trehalose 6-phosphate phosphatase
MRNILSRMSREVLVQFAWSKVLLAFDYDGTLAPIVPKPERAKMRATTHQLLSRLVKLYPCIVISGRAQSDACKRLQGIAVRNIIGNHGIEPTVQTNKLARHVSGWRPRLEASLAGLQGVRIEDKGLSLSIHYRQSRTKKKTLGAILDTAKELEGARLIGGKHVVNILPDNAPFKGTALVRERTRYQCDTAIYVGDDETDEDVFGLDQPGQLLAIRVGRRHASAAPYFIENQLKIDALLQLLLELRQGANNAQKI